MNWIVFFPELSLFLMSAVFFAASLSPRSRPRMNFLAAMAMAAAGLVVTLGTVGLQGTLFSGVYRADLFSQVFKVLLMIGLLLVIFLCSELKGIRESRHAEFYLLLSVCTLGMMVLVSSVELLTLYVALELTSYSLYILVALRKGQGLEREAGIKYFLLGASTSAVMLFGLACLYGAGRTTDLADLSRTLPVAIHTPLAFVGLLLTLAGFFFKLALFPFHVWAPTVYEGAANQVTAYIATASKAAAVAILIRLVALTGGASVDFAYVLLVLSLFSMTLGNLAAIVQKDFKRLLAYSAIAHAGYVSIGVVSMSQSGYASAIFYAAAYLVMNITCFLVLVKVAPEGGNVLVTDLAGLHRRSPLLAMALMLGVFSLGGIPPTIGFTGKFMVFTAAMNKGYFFLVFWGMVNVVISLYYYALVVKAAYLLKQEKEFPKIKLSLSTQWLTVLLVATLVGGGLFPSRLYDLALGAAEALIRSVR
jgi:NADH-quinone oxidoreductase subunit N